MRIYGLTGGAASGKSEAGRRFADLGIPVIDADKVGHELLEPGGAGVDAVLEAFGLGILTAGRIDRMKLAECVFPNPDARKKLNAILHPLIARLVFERCTQLAAQGHNAVIVEAALLAENGERDPWLAGLILMTCPLNMRLARLAERGLDPQQARQRIDAQCPPEAKIPLADWVIDNEGTLDHLRTQVDKIAEAIRAPET